MSQGRLEKVKQKAWSFSVEGCSPALMSLTLFVARNSTLKAEVEPHL